MLNSMACRYTTRTTAKQKSAVSDDLGLRYKPRYSYKTFFFFRRKVMYTSIIVASVVRCVQSHPTFGVLHLLGQTFVAIMTRAAV